MVETKSLTSTTSGLNIDGTAIHPITCCQQRLSYDKFHQRNSKNPTTLRRTGRFLIAERNNRKNEKMRHIGDGYVWSNTPLLPCRNTWYSSGEVDVMLAVPLTMLHLL